MPSTWKTFAANEVLTAADVNNALNPSTAPHIARAVAAGTAVISTSSATTSLVVPLPAGRFTAPPTVVITVYGTSGREHLYAYKVSATSSSQFTLWVVPFSGTSGTGNVSVNWIAMQS